MRAAADAAWEGGLSCVKAGLLDSSCITSCPTEKVNFGSDRAKDVIIAYKLVSVSFGL